MSNLLLNFAITLVLSDLLSIGCDSSGPIVSTRLGPIRGIVRTLDDGKSFINLFDGIRYAEPPVGPLRFRRPVAVTKWNGTLDATQMKNSCPQAIGFALMP